MSDPLLMHQDSLEKYDEVWEVHLSNQKIPYEMNEMEYAVFEDGLLSGTKPIIKFSFGSINTAYFVSSYRKSRKLKKEFQPKQLAEPEWKPPTPEQLAKHEKMMKELREKLGIRFSKREEK